MFNFREFYNENKLQASESIKLAKYQHEYTQNKFVNEYFVSYKQVYINTN